MTVNSHWVRVIGYLMLVILCFVARWREQGRADETDGVWRPFWLLTAGFLAAMAIGRAGDVGQLVSDLGRDRAGEAGWYEIRRPVQAAGVAMLGAAWLMIVVAGCMQSLFRRRRYLPMSLMVMTIAAYAAVRIVSLHDVDAVLYRREYAGAPIGTLVEMALLAITALATLWVPWGSYDEAPLAEADH